MGSQKFPRNILFIVAGFLAVPIVAYLFGASDRRSNYSDPNLSINREIRTTIPQIARKTESSNVKLTEVSKTSTHTQNYTIKPEIKGKRVTLQTFCVGPQGNLWMACQIASSNNQGAVMVYEPSGKLLQTHTINFVPQAINLSPNGSFYIAGSGKIAKMATDGRVETLIDAPNLINSKDDIAKAAKQAEEERSQLEKARKVQTNVLQNQLDKLIQAPEREDASEKRKREMRIKIVEQQLKMLSIPQPTVSRSTAQQSLARLMRSTAIAATETEVFVALPEPSGYGYGVWRLSSELAVDKKVLSGGRGCCGQYDLQTDGEHLIVAENTKFQVGVYDRNGKRLNGFGQKTRGGSDEAGFGSCCNPMNVRCCENGEILTAESSIGHIKRFSPDGKYLGFVGTAKIAGGCKHVAIGFDPKRNYYYMMSQDQSHVAVLVPRSDDPSMNLTSLQ